MKCAILAVGNEILLGDVLNSNAQSLSQSLSRAGYQPVLHLAVKDEAQDILEALEYSAAKAQILFVTGGLGPTSDDFTRKIIAQWTNTELKFDPHSWKYIEELFAASNYPMHEFQRQQCYFPQGAKILMNSQGTAPGFQMKKGEIELIVLPGPPREIRAIWDDHLASDLNSRIPQKERAGTRSWFCLGSGESQVAAAIEPLLEKGPFAYGYRTFFPYIEVRIEGLQNEIERADQFCETLLREMESLGPVYPTGTPLSLLTHWLERRNLSLELFDFTEHKILQRKLGSIRPGIHSPSRTKASPTLRLELRSIGSHQYVAGLEYGGQRRILQLAKPFRKMAVERTEVISLEYALWFWLRELSGKRYQLVSRSTR